MIGINLKAIVLKAAKAGRQVDNELRGRRPVVLRARRGIFTMSTMTSRLGRLTRRYGSKEISLCVIVEDLIYRLDEAEQKRIETGGTEK